MVLRFPSRRSGKVMISMPKVQSIRRRRMNGESIASIARSENVSEPTVRKYLKAGDLSPRPPVKRKHAESVIDRYVPVIEQWLAEDRCTWRKQRHTATRIWERLRDEYGAEVSLSTVTRKVAQLRRGSARGARGRLPRPGVASGRGAGRFRAGSTSGSGARCRACVISCWISRIRTSARASLCPGRTLSARARRFATSSSGWAACRRGSCSITPRAWGAGCSSG